MRQLPRLQALALLCAGSVGCVNDAPPVLPRAGTGAPVAAVTSAAPDFRAIFAEILVNGCVICHGAAPHPASNGNLLLPSDDPATAYRNLVQAMSSSGNCGSARIVVPGDSRGSLLFQKLSAAPPCGTRMPVGGKLSDAQLAEVGAWIDGGALYD